MQKPAIPQNELARLAALRKLNLLDTTAEQRFDRLTRLAKKVFGVPIALVSLVDSDRQWFKSKQGLDACETPRDISFCGHAILSDAIFEISDASQDPRFADNPLVTGPPDIRFYAGVPLKTTEGYRIGTLCLIDKKTRRLTEDEHNLLKDMASLVEAEFNHLQFQEQSTALKESQLLGEIITRAQSEFIRAENRHKAFDRLLNDMLELTASEYGFIGEVLKDAEGALFLKTHAITNIAWNAETRAFYEERKSAGMVFSNLKTLFGAALATGEVVISNKPLTDSRRGGLPEGHPALNAFLGIPIFHADQMVAMLGIANRKSGYDQHLVEFLKPLLATVGQLVTATRIQLERREEQKELALLSRVASQTTNGVIVTDAQGRTQWINQGFTRLTGYILEDIIGKSPGEILQGEQTDPDVINKMKRALSNKESFNVDVINYTKNGRPYWVRISCNPTYSKNGEHEGYIAIEVDITLEKKDAERIRISERRLLSIIEGTNIGTWEWDVQTGETVFNERWAEIVGYTLKDLAPVNIDTWTSLAHPEDLKRSGALLEQHFSGKSDYYDCVARMRHKNGHWVWVHDRGRVVTWAEDGKPVLMSGTHADITEQKQAELALQENEARLRGLFELSPIGISLSDFETGQFIDLNPALLAPTGYTRDEFVQLRYWDVTPVDYEKQEQEQQEIIRKTGRYGPYEKEYIRKDGSRYPVLLNGMIVEEHGGRKLIWSIVEDISERKRIDRMKHEFISTVSHELRTPLTAISGALGLAKGGALGDLPDSLSKLLDIAYKNCQRLNLLINDLLDMEKLLAGKMSFELQRQALKPLLEQALESNQAYAGQCNVNLVLVNCESGLFVSVDSARFAQIMANLLSNAAKFSPEGGKVEVSACRDSGKIRVMVRDYGDGIPQVFQPHIFQKFSQADSSDSRQKGGTGLGLAISRELVERMHGSISFNTSSDGTEFFFLLPEAIDP